MQTLQPNPSQSQTQLQSNPNFFVSNLYPIHDPLQRSIPILQSMINDFVREKMKLEYFNGNFYNPFSENKIKHEGEEYKILYGFHLLCISIKGHPVLSVSPRILLFSSFPSFFLLLPLRKLKSLLLGKFIKTIFPSCHNYYKIEDIVVPTSSFLEELYIQLQLKTKIAPIFSYPSFCFPILKLEEGGMLPLEYCIRIWEEDSILGGLKKTALPKIDKVLQLLRKVLKNLDQTPNFSQLGLTVDLSPIKFPLLLLPPPTLHLSSSVLKSLRAAINSDTVFSFNEKLQSLALSENFLTFPNLQKWTFVVSRIDVELAQCFLDETQNILRKNGLTANKPDIVVFEDVFPNKEFDQKDYADSGSWMTKIFPPDYFPTLSSSLIAIVIVPSYLPPFSSFYSETKLGLTFLGVVSQFIQTKTIQASITDGALRGLAERILNQIIAKTGYVPWRLENAGVLRTPTIVIGIREDEILGEETGKKRAILSSVSSMNKDYTKYWSSFLISPSCSSLLSLLCFLLFQSLEKFISVVGIQPTQILLLLDLLSPPPSFLIALEEEFYKTERNSIIHPKLISLLLLPHPSSSFLLPTPPVGGFARRENEILGHLGREDGKLARGIAWEIAGGVGVEGIEEGLMQLTFLNFNLNGTSDYPGPMNYSWRLGKFIKMALEEWDGEEEEILERMRRMAEIGKLYFL